MKRELNGDDHYEWMNGKKKKVGVWVSWEFEWERLQRLPFDVCKVLHEFFFFGLMKN